jgi:glycosyltransferase involved in cell wall biosynthesis
VSLDVGGLERVVLGLVRAGQKLGQRVAVVCLERPGTLAAEVEAAGARVLCVHKKPGIRLGVVGDLASVFRRLRPDVVHTHQVAPLFYVGPAARRAGAPLLVHTEHGKNYATRLRTRLLGRLAARPVARFFCVSEDIAAEVRSNNIAPRWKVCVVRNGIDTAHFRNGDNGMEVRQSLGIPAEVPLVGTIGRLNEIKRQDLLLRAFARLRQDVPAAHLLLVGDGPLLGDLRRLAGELGVTGCVHFAGYQAQPERYLKVMDVFALTSRSEGMPLVVLEAWAAGVPVVASRVGGLVEMIDPGRTGVLFPSGDEAALEGCLRGLLADKEAARRMGEAGRGRVEALFDIRQTAGSYHQHYLELLARRANHCPARAALV